MRAEGLQAFYRTLQIDPSSAPPGEGESETSRVYSFNKQLSDATQQSISASAIELLKEPFGQALTLTIGVSVQPLLEIRSGQWPSNLAQQVAAVRAAPSGQLLTLQIDKGIILASLPASGPDCTMLYYLFTERFVRFLEMPLTMLDGELFPDDGKITVVIISDANIQYEGPLFAVIGETRYGAGGISLSSPKLGTRVRVDRYRKAAAEQLSWSGITLAHLTPLHLLCQPMGVGDPRLTAALSRRLWQLAVLFTANRSSWADGTIRAIYAGPERTATVILVPNGPLPDSVSLLTRFALWPYGGRQDDTDRLTILQNVLARALESDNATSNATLLASRLRELLTEAQWHHRVFLDGQIDKHFQQMRAAADYVSEVAKSFGEAVDTLAKGLSDAALATVAAIVAVVVTPLVKNDVPPLLVGAVTAIYALYLLIFQILYRLGGTWESATLLHDEAAVRLTEYENALGQSRLAALKKQSKDRWDFFERWFRRTRRLFWALFATTVLMAAGWPALLGPGRLSGVLGAGITTPTPVVQPSSMAAPRNPLTTIIAPTTAAGASVAIPTSPVLVVAPAPVLIVGPTAETATPLATP